MIPIFSNSLGVDEAVAVADVFKSHWLGRGPQCAAFEAEFAAHLGTSAEHVLLCNSCTAGMHVGLRALGIGAGDEVIVPTVHFVAAATLPLELGATVILADVNAWTLNVEPEEIARRLTKRTKAVLLLHYGGHPCDIDAIREVVGPGVGIIEDTANGVSSRYHGRACGTLGDAGMWSFDAMKMLVMGDGGALWLRDGDVIERALRLRYLGLREATASGTDAQSSGKTHWWEFEVGEPSGRFISNDVAAAMGRIQLKRLEGFIARRRAIWETYQHELADCGLRLPPEPPEGCTTSYYFYWVQTARRDALAYRLREAGVYTTFRYYPMHRALRMDGVYPGADVAADTTLNLPLHQNLTDEDLGHIISTIRSERW